MKNVVQYYATIDENSRFSKNSRKIEFYIPFYHDEDSSQSLTSLVSTSSCI